MKLATRNNGTRDGELVVVHSNSQTLVSASSIAANLQAALDDWDASEPKLRGLAEQLETGQHTGAEPVDLQQLLSPLPRAYEWIDGSAYINHIVLVRKARGAEPPATLETDPLVYQGGSGAFLAPREPIPLLNDDQGLDLEAEICVVLGDTPLGTSASDAPAHVRLLMLANDVTLRNLIPEELKKGFGFFVSKPATAFAPFALTPDELGDHFRGGRMHLPLCSYINNRKIGHPHAGPEMHFSFYDLIAHITQTRRLTAGTILGSGTVSNEDAARGVSCLAERRMREILESGEAKTPFLKPDDEVRIEMCDADGRNLFGTICQKVVRV